MKFHQYHQSLASAAQPSLEQFKELKAQGWDVILNLSPASTRNALRDEALVVEQLSMDYVHFPVDCSELRPSHYQTFRDILKALEDRRVVVHCGGNIKSSNLIHMYQVLENRVPVETSLATLKTIHDPEPKWFTYFEAMGVSQGEKEA
jgi:protein tyrosine phosphatase (PTP) superfamily phosphohydrolase (DUF442 family)